MRLKSLVIYGFKSFPEKTSFDFGPGITGIVGPNGCGKSNVVDAVRWTLGEQSAKKLRGQEMSDVIFNGSASRKPLGYCEVSLTFENNRNLLPVDYTEVCITRRLYRTGESEYMLNKQPCRLKDIKELFMDTGIGVDSYSSIEQGKVDLLLNANSKERRFVFEEAAGISRYKAKRKECMAKLDRTEANLQRAEDVIGEVESRTRSLRRQAVKAKRYKVLQDEIRDLKVKFSEHRFRELSRSLEEERERIGHVSAELATLTESRGRIESQAAEKEGKRLTLDDELSGLQGRLTGLQGTIEASQERVQAEQKRIEELDFQQERLAGEEQNVQRRIEELEGKIVDATERLGESRNTLASLQEEITTGTRELEEAARYEDRLRFAVEEKKSTVVDLLQERAKRENRLGALSSKKQLLGGQKDRLLDRIESLRGGVRTSEERRRDVALKRIEKKDGAKSVEVELVRLHDRISSADDDISEMRRTLTQLDTRRATMESRRDLLCGLDARGEGLSSGVKLLMSEDGDRYRLLADGLKVGMEHVVAVEAALGERSQALVTPTMEDAREGVRTLRGKGRAIFIPIDHLPEIHETLEAPEGLSRLMSFVECEPQLRPVLEYLLSDTYVTASIEEAMELGAGAKGRFVSLDGCVVQGPCVSAGRTHNEEGGIIWRRTQIEEIDVDLDRVAGERDVQSSRLTSLRSEAGGMREELLKREKTLDDTTEEIRIFEQDIAHQLKERNRLNKEITACGEEISDMGIQLRTVESEVNVFQDEINAINTERERTDREIEVLSGRLAGISEKRKGLDASLTSLKVKAAQTEEAVRRVSEEITRDRNETAERKNSLIQCRSDREGCAARRGEAEREVARSRDMLESSLAEKAEIDSKISSAQEMRSEISGQIEELNGRRRELDDQIRSMEGDLQELRIKEGELSVRIEDLQESVHNDYGMELTGRRDVEEEVNWEGVEARIKEIKDKMLTMGNVNLQAIDELAELEGRANFLITQRDDLVKAKTNLQSVIQKINRVSREKFQETFDAVRVNFQDMFRKMFGGGKADIFLEEGEDVLEAGIEIIAKPPGKELRTLSLLSGGEKALTAVALLFAIFKSRPSPFCILDEVDASLDESNVQRFVNVLQEFLEHSQFLLITHNKKSMSIADCLYGVTMQEPGVSKKIAVRLQEAAEMAETA